MTKKKLIFAIIVDFLNSMINTKRGPLRASARTKTSLPENHILLFLSFDMIVHVVPGNQNKINTGS